MAHEPQTASHLPSRRSGSLSANASIVFIGNLVARALGFLFPLLLAHLTGKREFALVYFFINTGFTVGELVLTGFPTATTRQIAVDRADPQRGRWVRAGVLGGLPLLGLSMIGGELLAFSGDAPPILMSIMVVGLTVDAYYFGVLRGLERFRLLIGYRISANLVQIIGLSVLAWAGAVTVTSAVILYAGVYLIPMVVIELRMGPLLSLLRAAGPVTRGAMRAIVAFAIPALISGTAYGVVFGFDVFSVRIFSPGSLADYGAARTLAQPMLMVPYAVGVVLMPRTAALSERERLRFLARSMLVTVLSVSALVCAYLWLGPFAVTALLPASYARALDPLRWLAPSLGLLGIYSVLSQWWLGSGRPGAPALSLGGGAVMTLVAHATVTRNLGAVGAGISIGIGAAFAIVVLGSLTLRQSMVWRRP